MRVVARLGTCSHARKQLAVREGWCYQRSERLRWGSALLWGDRHGAAPVPWDHVPPAAPGRAGRGPAAFPKSGVRSHPPEWEFMVKAPFATDAMSCQGCVVRNELLPLGRLLLLSGKSQQRVINHRAGQSCLLPDGEWALHTCCRGVRLSAVTGCSGPAWETSPVLLGGRTSQVRSRMRDCSGNQRVSFLPLV